MNGKLYIYNICWNTEGEDVDLPEKVVCEAFTEEEIDKMHREENMIPVCNWLVKEYGYSIECCNVWHINKWMRKII